MKGETERTQSERCTIHRTCADKKKNQLLNGSGFVVKFPSFNGSKISKLTWPVRCRKFFYENFPCLHFRYLLKLIKGSNHQSDEILKWRCRSRQRNVTDVHFWGCSLMRLTLVACGLREGSPQCFALPPNELLSVIARFCTVVWFRVLRTRSRTLLKIEKCLGRAMLIQSRSNHCVYSW